MRKIDLTNDSIFIQLDTKRKPTSITTTIIGRSVSVPIGTLLKDVSAHRNRHKSLELEHLRKYGYWYGDIESLFIETPVIEQMEAMNTGVPIDNTVIDDIKNITNEIYNDVLDMETRIQGRWNTDGITGSRHRDSLLYTRANKRITKPLGGDEPMIMENRNGGRYVISFYKEPF